MFKKMQRFLGWFVFLIAVFTVGDQWGIHNGRIMEREDLATYATRLDAVTTALKGMMETPAIRGIIQCESGGRHEGLWGEDGEYGHLQFKEASFNFLANRMGFKNADWKNKNHQVAVAAWAVQNGYGPWWACFDS